MACDLARAYRQQHTTQHAVDIDVALSLLGTAAADWDRRGWEKLGERTVNGRVDRDTIIVGRDEGRFTKLNIVVENSELELLELTVTFANNQTYRPAVRHYFRANSRTRVIDLPGNDRIIKRIDVKYRNLPRGGNARLEVFQVKAGRNDRRR